jgi:hypothetical protein
VSLRQRGDASGFLYIPRRRKDTVVQSRDQVNLHAGRGVAVREFTLQQGYGKADYMLFVDAKAVGVIEAKPEGETELRMLVSFRCAGTTMGTGAPKAHDDRAIGERIISFYTLQNTLFSFLPFPRSYKSPHLPDNPSNKNILYCAQ